MSPAEPSLHGFAYGEHLEGLPPRSLGFRLLAPADGEPWGAEVEGLAHRLQAAPYPDHWPAADLFCSVLLTDGRRLVALARYGLEDHTPSRRRGGLELIGVVGPAELSVPAALAIYRWLQQRRGSVDDLRTLGGQFPVGEAVSTGPPAPPPGDPVPVLPIRLWQEGVLLFAATTPSDPDHRLGLLEQGAGGNWQWLPLVGADFPLQTFAGRGPVVAWTPHLSGVALKLDRRPGDAPVVVSGRGRKLTLAALALVLVLLGANLAAFLWLNSKVDTAAPAAGAKPPAEPAARGKDNRPTAESDEKREAFARALHALLTRESGPPEWTPAQLLAQYERLALHDPNLQLNPGNTEGKRAVGTVRMLSQRSAESVQRMVRKALTNKGYSPHLIDAACKDVHDLMTREVKEGP